MHGRESRRVITQPGYTAPLESSTTLLGDDTEQPDSLRRPTHELGDQLVETERTEHLNTLLYVAHTAAWFKRAWEMVERR